MSKMKHNYAKVSPKGWVVIPAELRRRFGIKPGTMVIFEEVDGRIILRPVPNDPVEMLAGMFKGEPSFTEELLEERRKELEDEKREFGRMGSG
jgi:AbrB family looped-hinge helix DNA binding protein